MNTEDLKIMNRCWNDFIQSAIELYGNGLSMIRNCRIDIKKEFNRERVSDILASDIVDYLNGKGAEQVARGHIDTDTIYFVLNLENQTLNMEQAQLFMDACNKRNKHV